MIKFSLSDSVKKKIRFEVPPSALERWQKDIRAADDEQEESGVYINIYSTVGEYGDGGGMTAKIVSSILRKAEGRAVTVNINSGGGDFFEGVAIHNLLAEYEGEVTVRVLGLAASAASIVAMAGDKIKVAKSGFIMIHNSWTLAIGNKDDMREVADLLEKFDGSMAALYAEKTNIEEKEIKKMMAAETWLKGEDALELNFAHALLSDDEAEKKELEETKTNAALRKIDVALAKAGVSRSERREMIKDLVTPRADENETMPSAGEDEKTALLKGILNKLKG